MPEKAALLESAGFFFPCMTSPPVGYNVWEVIAMATVAPGIRDKFDSMPPELQQAVLQLDARIENLSDLMSCLERIIEQGEEK